MLGQQKRQVPKPDLIGPHRTPSIQKIDGEQAAHIRRTVLGTLGVIVVVTLIGFVVYGPMFRITVVQVTGTQMIQPKSIQAATENYLHRTRWLFLPNRTLWILSARGLESYLQKLIQQRLSIEGLNVTKQRPNTITITITERSPIATWTDGAKFGAIDRHGVIIEKRTAAASDLLIIHDLNSQPFPVDSSVVKQLVMEAITTLRGDLELARIDVQEYQIPVPVCPVTTPVVTNTNTALNTNTAKSANNNTNVANTNSNVTEPTPMVVMPPCDLQALRYSSQEIYVKLKEGPIAYFDRQNDLGQAVQTLQRVLTQPNAKSYTTIDVRFGDRVFVK